MAIRRAKFASGRHSKAISDRSGAKIDYRDLRQEWNGLWVHKDEWEPKHPQLEPRSAIDGIALEHPRPGSHSREDALATLVRPEVTGTFFISGPLTFASTHNATGNAGSFSVGTATLFVGIRAVATGQGLTGALGTPVGRATTGTLTGQALTGSVGTAAGKALTGSLTGQEMTGAVGTATVDLHGWGIGTFGSGEWGV